ncbi:MAG TPA: A24 family peptidase [Acidimicrobiales bacterium]|nr:A24 family peptidase [Acidimicrobiales bacterium]
MTFLGVVACALLGVGVGTYVNLLIDLVPQKRRVTPLRAACRACIDTTDRPRRRTLVPWLLRAGRCPSCSEAVSSRYAVVEVATVALFAAAAVRFGVDAALPAYLVFLASLLAISVIDLEHKIIPNRIVYPTIVVCIPLLALAALVDGDGERLVHALIGGAAAFTFLFVVNLVYPAGMGFGDVRLSFVLGLMLGWLSLGHVVAGMFLGFVLGAVVGLGLVVVTGRSRKDALPFGPFLAAGAVVAVFVGRPLIDWWLGT